jgi:hypothetical protein
VAAVLAISLMYLFVVTTLCAHKTVALLVISLLVIVLADRTILADGRGNYIRVISLRALVAVRELVVLDLMFAPANAFKRVAATST